MKRMLARVLPLADDPDSMVRFQTALALGEANRDPRVIEALVKIAVRDAADVWTRTAVLSSISQHTPAFIEALAARPGFFQTQAGRGWLDELSILVGSARDPGETQRLVERLIKSGTPNDVLINVLAALGKGLRRSGKSPSEAYRGMEAKRLRVSLRPGCADGDIGTGARRSEASFDRFARHRCLARDMEDPA